LRRFLLLAICLAGIPAVAGANTWTVTNTEDHDVGFCTTSDCTLREAITIASSGDVINFAPGVTGKFTLGGAGELFIQQSITINGPGANVLAVDGGLATRIFEIKNGFTVAISGLTISNGFVNTPTPSFGEAQGGGILNNGKLYLTDCDVVGNLIQYSGRSMGGGLCNNNGSTAIIRRCTFDFNEVQGSEAWGGGMASRSASVIAINSTFSSNVVGPQAPLNSGIGGGVMTVAATVTLVNCTIASNSYVSGAGATLTGGGIARTGGGAVFLWNTLIANNSASQSPDASGSFSSLGHNLIGNSAGSSSWVSSDKLDAAAAPVNLGGLAANGGPTKTHAITVGSVAINAGDDTVNDPGADGIYGNGDDGPITTDQRGPGFPRILGAHIDIGAFEADQPQPGPILSSPPPMSIAMAFAVSSTVRCGMPPMLLITTSLITASSLSLLKLLGRSM